LLARRGMGTRVPQPHLLCHPLHLLTDVGEKDAIETLLIGPSLAEPAGVALQEGRKRHVPGSAGGAGLGTGGCQGLGTHHAVLTDAESIPTAQPPKHIGVAVFPLAQPARCRGRAALSPAAPRRGASAGHARSGMGERPEHLPCMLGPLLALPDTRQNPP